MISIELKNIFFGRTDITGDGECLFSSQSLLAQKVVEATGSKQKTENYRIFIGQVFSGKRPLSEKLREGIRQALHVRLRGEVEKVEMVMQLLNDSMQSLRPAGLKIVPVGVVHIKKLVCSLRDLQTLMQGDKSLVVDEVIIDSARE